MATRYFTSAPATQEIPQTELNLHLYMYQLFEGTPSGNEKQAVPVRGHNFGTIFANDWTMYDGPGPNANLVARVQGVHHNCDMVLPDSWIVSSSIVFVDERFKGSTLKVVGNYGGGGVDEWAIVGGTGEFGFAQGVGTFTKIKEDKDGNIREFKIHVRYPTPTPTPVPAPLKKAGPFGGDSGRDFDLLAQRVESVTIYSADVIYKIEFSYIDKDGKQQTSDPWGGPGREKRTITFASGETLTKVYGTIGTRLNDTCVSSLTFITNLQAYTFGDVSGVNPFHMPEKEATVLGFFGRAGLWLNAIGAYYVENN